MSGAWGGRGDAREAKAMDLESRLARKRQRAMIRAERRVEDFKEKSRALTANARIGEQHILVKYEPRRRGKTWLDTKHQVVARVNLRKKTLRSRTIPFEVASPKLCSPSLPKKSIPARFSYITLWKKLQVVDDADFEQRCRETIAQGMAWATQSCGGMA